MEGRLLPKYQGRYQAHPVGYWQDEFSVAKTIGLDCIEFILDFNDAEINPLIKDGGVDELQSIIDTSGVGVKTICADYFMEAPLHVSDETAAATSLDMLHVLLDNAAKLGVSDVVIPCVDQSSLRSDEEAAKFIQVLQPLADKLEKLSINLSLETDLNPEGFYSLLKKFDSPRVTVNYDIGNSAALNYDPVEELQAYGNRITDIHIKDRVSGGGPVTLGEGNADFDKFFTALADYRYQGPFIMQAYRDDEGVEIFKKQLAWIKPYIEQYASKLGS